MKNKRVEYNTVSKSLTSLDIRGSLSTWGTWERLVPKQIANDPGSQKLLKSHLRRYEAAMSYSSGKQVLDIACGTGYGSQMLRTSGAASVVGVDKFPIVIQYARQNYQIQGIEFVCVDAEEFEWPEQFDTVISFETLEHLPNPDKFLGRVRSLLRPEGKLLLSVPLGETRHIDPYHLHSFSQEDVFVMLEKSGFLVEQYHCDHLFLTSFELIQWRKLYPESPATIYDLLFTHRGQQLMHNIIFRGGLLVPELLVIAHPTQTSL